MEVGITCPLCGVTAQEAMPTDRCIYFYECTGCGAVLKPKAGDCCVFCSYSDRRCPSAVSPCASNASQGLSDDPSG
ncbi:MAG: GDCCVxC domain-containing (seleno)protein [Vicinamibacterales bacterium]